MCHLSTEINAELAFIFHQFKSSYFLALFVTVYASLHAKCVHNIYKKNGRIKLLVIISLQQQPNRKRIVCKKILNICTAQDSDDYRTIKINQKKFFTQVSRVASCVWGNYATIPCVLKYSAFRQPIIYSMLNNCWPFERAWKRLRLKVKRHKF